MTLSKMSRIRSKVRSANQSEQANQNRSIRTDQPEQANQNAAIVFGVIK